MQDLKILSLQSDLAWENPKKNRENFFRIIDVSFSGQHLVVLPETFTTGFPVDPHSFAENIEGESMHWMAETAHRFNTVLTGSLLLDNGDNYTNTLIFMHPDGTFERYDKRHVFSMGGEHERIKRGEKELIVKLYDWKIKPMVCYDLRFPVWNKNRYEKSEYTYDLAIYVANWPAVRTFSWKQLLIARAIENLVFVLGVNRIGYDGLGNYYSGYSQLIDFKGRVLSECAAGKTCAMKSTLSFENLKKFRNKFNVGPDWDYFTIKK